MPASDSTVSEPLVHTHATLDSLMEALAAAVVARLRAALAVRAAASLLVPGGRTPLPLFARLAAADLDWSRVWVTLTDERVVAVDDAASNERLVRGHLLVGRAAAARLVGWRTATGIDGDDVGALWQHHAVLPRPIDVVVLGMGEDGHFASLFPGTPGLGEALDEHARPACVATRAPAPPTARLSFNLSALVEARSILLPLPGAAKHAVYARAGTSGSALELPVRALLAQRRAPLEVHFAP